MPNMDGARGSKTAVFNVTGEVDRNEAVEITINNVDTNVINATIDGTHFHIDVQHVEYDTIQRSVPSHLHCLVNGVSRKFSICQTSDGHTYVLIDGYAARFDVRTGPKHTFVRSELRGAGNKSPILAAPMPAIVMEILVDIGDHVCVGDPLIRIEAMKMVTTLNAFVDGVVQDIGVIENQTVKAGEMLIQIEPIQDNTVSISQSTEKSL